MQPAGRFGPGAVVVARAIAGDPVSTNAEQTGARLLTELLTRRTETSRNGRDVASQSRARHPTRFGVERHRMTPETAAVIFGTKKSWVRIPPPRPSYRSQFSGDSGRSERSPDVELQTVFANTEGTKSSRSSSAA